MKNINIKPALKFVIAFVLVAWALYTMLVAGQSQAFESARTKEFYLKKEIEAKYKASLVLDAYKKQQKELEQQFSTLINILPSHFSDVELNRQIVNLLKQNELKLHEFSPGVEVSKDFYAQKTIDLKVSGDFKNLVNFLYELNDQGQIKTIGDYSLYAYQKHDVIYQGQFNVYRYLDRDEIRSSRKRKK